MKNILCILGLHDYEKVGPIKPIKSDNEFSQYAYEGHFALGKCKRNNCGHEALVRCGGKYEWKWGDEKTRSEYMTEYNREKSDKQ